MYFVKNFGKIKRSGPMPDLSDAEVITMEIAGEFLGCGRGLYQSSSLKQYFYPVNPLFS
jgi:hypothetical protein